MPLYPPSGGGSSFDPHSPGPIGDVTPNSITATAFSNNGFQCDNSGNGNIANGIISWDFSGNFSLPQGIFPATGQFEIGTDIQFDGNMIANNLPTSDPHVANEFWSNLGILTISAG